MEKTDTFFVSVSLQSKMGLITSPIFILIYFFLRLIIYVF